MSNEHNDKECIECKEPVDSEEQQDDCQWSNVKDGWVCWSCYEQDLQHTSTVIFIGDGDPYKVYVGDLTVMTEYGDDISLDITRVWHSTDGWRGYYVTQVKGWVTVADGWTTGGWGDMTARRKAIYNDWVESLIDGETVPPVPMAIVCDPTSNVFSMAQSVIIPADKAEVFGEWFEQYAHDIEHALA